MQLEDPKHRFTSQTQRMALVDLLDSCDLQSQDRADLVTMLSSCNFAQDDMVCLLEKVAGPSMPAGAKGWEDERAPSDASETTLSASSAHMDKMPDRDGFCDRLRHVTFQKN